MHEFIEHTDAFIRRHRLLKDGQALLAAVSGGADSVALAAALHGLDRYKLHVAHIHHGLRPEADADAAFVADLARDWGLPFHVERIDTPALAREWRIGTEEAARRGRYESLAGMAAAARAQAVAVAHHADDQVETILHRLVRGTHLRGLAGMRPARPMSDSAEGGADVEDFAAETPATSKVAHAARALTLVRPLLWARRADIEQFCRDAGLAWRTDQTNLSGEYTRNFIRNDLLPLLRSRLNPKVDEAILRLGQSAGDAEAALDKLAGRLYERARRRGRGGQVVLRLAPLRRAPRLIAAMALRRALAELGAPEQDLSAERFEELLSVVDGRQPSANLPGALQARRQGQDLLISGR